MGGARLAWNTTGACRSRPACAAARSSVRGTGNGTTGNGTTGNGGNGKPGSDGSAG